MSRVLQLGHDASDNSILTTLATILQPSIRMSFTDLSAKGLIGTLSSLSATFLFVPVLAPDLLRLDRRRRLGLDPVAGAAGTAGESAGFDTIPAAELVGMQPPM
jgi:hypothetical protein